MRKSFVILIVLFGLGSAFTGVSNWYYHEIMSHPEMSSFSKAGSPTDELYGLVFVFGSMPDLIHARIVNLISPIPTEDKFSDQQVILHSKNIPEVQSFLAKYPNATSYVDRSGSFLLKYTSQKQYKPDYWNYDDQISLGLSMYTDGNPYKITIYCNQDTVKRTTQVLEYLEIETCLREPIPAKEKSELMPLCNPLGMPPSSLLPGSNFSKTAPGQEEMVQYHLHDMGRSHASKICR